MSASGSSTIHFIPGAFQNSNPNASLNIVFIHGLTGEWDSSWNFYVSRGMLGWLAEDLSAVNIYSASYKSSFLRDALNSDGGGIKHLASSVLAGITTELHLDTPILFVTHSLGGIVAKEVLRICQDSPVSKHQRLLSNVKGVVFIATPHQGSTLAQSIHRILTLGWLPFGNFKASSLISAPVKELATSTSFVIELSHWFQKFVERNKSVVHSFYETEPYHRIVIVSPEEADPNIGSCVPVAIQENHITIAKPSSRRAQLYRSLKSLVAEVLPVERIDLDRAADSINLLLDFEFYTSPAPSNRRTLAEKFESCGRAHETTYAEQKKERFDKAIQRHVAQPSSLHPLVGILAEVESRFTRHVRLAIDRGDTSEQINDLVQEKVLKPIAVELRKSDETATIAAPECALYYLTGNCHIEWDK